MREHAIGPGGSRYGRVPVVANYKFPRQGVQNRELVGRVALHHVKGAVISRARAVCGNISGIIDRRVGSPALIGRSRPTKLCENVLELVPWVVAHSVGS